MAEGPLSICRLGAGLVVAGALGCSEDALTPPGAGPSGGAAGSSAGAAGTTAADGVDAGELGVDAGSDAGGSDGGAEPPEPRYVVASVVDAPNGRTTYFNVTGSLAADVTLDFADAREVPGNARLYGSDRLGWFALGGGESPIITRFELSNDDRFVESATLSFANYGVASLGLAVAFVGERDAYYLDQDATQQLITWDPTDMVITGSIDLPSLEPEPGETLYATLAQRGSQLLVFAGYTDWDAGTARPSSVFVIVDTESHSVLSSSVVEGCSHATNFVQVPNGDMYIASEVDATLYHDRDDSDGSAGCLLRLPAGADSLDAEPIQLAQWTGTEVSGGLVPGPEGSLIFQAYDEAVAPLDTTDVLAAYRVAAWRFWRWQPGQDTAERLDGEPQAVNNLLMRVDGAGYVTGPAEDPSSAGSRLVETAASGGPRPGLASPGFISNVVRVR